jgi:hypothetical protein
MIFILLAVVGVTVAAFVFFTDEPPALKLMALGALVVSAALQFPSTRVHFLVPLLIQVALGLWMLIYWKVKR